MNDLENIIFDNRNKAYGAYDLRRRNPAILAWATGVGIFLFVFSIALFKMSSADARKQVSEAFYVYDISDSIILQPPAKSYEPPLAAGGAPVPVPIPVVVDSVPELDTLVNRADGQGTDTTGRGIGAGHGTGDGHVFYAVQQPPVFRGGDTERIKFLRRNINYPPQARKNKVQGTVHIAFIVEKDGTITNARVVKGIGYGCDEEALRVVQSMPAWIPGKQNGVAVRVHVNWPIVF